MKREEVKWVIIITTKDLFGKNRQLYTFENRCVEEPELSLEDGARRIFLNSEGTIEYREDLAKLLHYIVKSQGKNAVNDTTKQLHNIVERVRRKPELGVRFMKSWEREWWAKAEGKEEVRQEYNQLILQLSKDQRLEDIVKAASDAEYRDKLFVEYGIMFPE